MTIGIAAAMMGAGTFAYFDDVETSTGNTIAAGTIDIKVALVDSTWYDESAASQGTTTAYSAKDSPDVMFTFAGVMPGHSGIANIDVVLTDFDADITMEISSITGTLGEVLDLVVSLDTVGMGNPGDFVGIYSGTLATWSGSKTVKTEAPPGTYNIVFEWSLDTTVDNTYKGATCGFSVGFTAEQDHA